MSDAHTSEFQSSDDQPAGAATSDRGGCPPTEELRGLIRGSLPAERQDECTRHLDGCQCCQAKIEDLATGGTNFSRVVSRLDEAEPLATSAYWPAIRALDSDTPAGRSGAASTPASGSPGGMAAPAAAASAVAKSAERAAARPRDVPLSFLQPAGDDAYLGRLAHFDVMRVIGRGGMGIVLEAFDSRLRRHVAIKVLDPALAGDDVARQRFCREARAAAAVTHENVVAVHQVEKSVDDSLPYMVMQLVPGETLEQRLEREKSLPLREIVRIGMQAAQGLAAAHAQGLIHRDIKPGNIILESPQDRVKLTDFGLARVADDVRLTHTGFVAGTPLYMSPEQSLGGEADPRSDLFSLGAVLYEMCAGEPPFGGDSAPLIMKRIVDTRHRPLRELNPRVPEWLAETIDRLLAKKPADRIQTAAHLAELLEFQWALLKTSSEDVPTICQIEARREARRNRLIALGVAAGFLTLGLIGGALLAGKRGGSDAAEAEHAAAAADPFGDRGAGSEAIAVLSANAGAVWSVSFDPPSQTVAMAVEDGSVRLWDLASKSVKSTFTAHRGVVWSSQYSHSGELLATAGDDDLLKLWRPSQADPIRSFRHPSAVRGLAIAKDDRTLFTGDREGNLRVWSLDSTEPLAQAQQPGVIYALAVSPDNATLATAGSDKIVRLWNAQTLSQRLPLEGHAGPVYGLSFSRDGSRLASVGWDKTVRIWDAGSGQLVRSWEGHSGDIWSVAYSPRRDQLATGGTDGAARLWDANTGALLATYRGHKSAIHIVAFDQTGSLLASGSRDGSARVWKVE